MKNVPTYEPAAVEARWQRLWEERHVNEPDVDRPRRPFYNLMMFPYPSAEGLHVGNMFAFTGADIYGRFKRLAGYDVFEPIGFDAFGIHSENYALSIGAHPAKLIPQNIATFRRQLRRFGGMFDWRHELSTTDPRYYKWMQCNWIGRSEGAELAFETPGGAVITVFTTRPDTVFGATYMVLAPEHPLVDELTADEQRPVVNAYRREVQTKDIVSRKVGEKTKTGVFLGSYARNPATGEAIPVWIADYVLMEYGTGAIMAVPAHHEADVQFAQQFKLPIVQVVRLQGQALPIVSEEGGVMNSGQFNRLPCRDGAQRLVQGLPPEGPGTAP